MNIKKKTIFFSLIFWDFLSESDWWPLRGSLLLVCIGLKYLFILDSELWGSGYIERHIEEQNQNCYLWYFY